MTHSFSQYFALAVWLSSIAGWEVSAVEPSTAEPIASAFYNGLARANGKQITRVGEQWLVVTPDPTGQRAWLATAPRTAPIALASDWENRLFLSLDDKGVFRSRGASAVPPSVVVDRAGRVHVAWSDGESVWYARSAGKVTDVGALLRDRSSWVGADGREPRPILADATLGDLAVSNDGEVYLAAVKRTAESSTTLCLARHGDKGEWTADDVAKGAGFHPPVLHLSADASVHLAWSDTRGRVLYLRHRRGETAEPRVLSPGGYGGNGRNPTILATGRQILVAYESLYAQIEYAVEEAGVWRTYQRLTSLDRRLATDVLHSPQLAVDRHGVVWLFFSDVTRRFTYFTRWLGSGWSDIYDCRGIYYRAPRFETNLLAADWFAVEKHPPAQATEIGVALANSLATDKREFHAIAVPAPATTAGSTTLFFDLLETAGLNEVELVLDEAQKHADNPVLKRGETGAFDQDRVLNHGSVIFDKDKFRMWYSGVYRRKGVYWWEQHNSGYAESKDGIAWKKVPIGVVDTDRESDRNRLPLVPWPCALFKDAHDADPQRRYKIVQFDRHQRQLMAAVRGEYDMAAPTNVGQLLQSPDGIHWTSEPISISFPDGKPWELVVQSFFIDPDEPDPARRWKVYGYATLTARRRAGCFAYSADGRKWTSYPRNPILDPTVSEVPLAPSGPLSQIHDTVVFPYRGYYLALFHAQHDPNFLDVELAVSRDGVNFAHVRAGQKVIPLGERGAWDWQQILQTVPVVAADRLWLYYGGQTQTAEWLARGQFNNEQIVGSAGLATLRLDGFTHLSLKPAKTAGTMTTVPFEVRDDGPLQLVVNAACSAEATITVEVLDADTEQPISGYTRDDCIVLTNDGLKQVVRWKDSDRLPIAGRRRLAFRFGLQGSAAAGPRLYGFGFVAARSK
jgi:hypothetical protein